MKLPHDIRYMTLFEACFKTSILLPSLMAFMHVSVASKTRTKTPIISSEVHVSIMNHVNEVIEKNRINIVDDSILTTSGTRPGTRNAERRAQSTEECKLQQKNLYLKSMHYWYSYLLFSPALLSV